MAYPSTSNPSADFTKAALVASDLSPSAISTGIVDNYSAVNNTTLKNSLGTQISLVQNFVNEMYLGRPTAQVANAYMTNVYSTNLSGAAVYGNSGIFDSYVECTQVGVNNWDSTSTYNDYLYIKFNQIPSDPELTIFAEGSYRNTAKISMYADGDVDINPLTNVSLNPSGILYIKPGNYTKVLGTFEVNANASFTYNASVATIETLGSNAVINYKYVHEKNWVDFTPVVGSTITEQCSYGKDATGKVIFKGTFTTSGGSLITLPVGFRPSTTKTLFIGGMTDVTIKCVVASFGSVSIINPSASQIVTLDQLSFYVD